VIVACVRGSIPASTLDTIRNVFGLNRAPAETILRKTHLAACEHIYTCDELSTIADSQNYRSTYNGFTGNRNQTFPKGQDAPRTPTSRKRTAQYEQTQETRWLKRFQNSIWRFGVLFGVFFLNIGHFHYFNGSRTFRRGSLRAARTTADGRCALAEYWV
jgi:hypothetical protein